MTAATIVGIPPINLRDYSVTAAARGWGLGWPSCAGAAGKTVIVTATRSGVRFSVHVRIARLVALLVDETERRGYLLRSGQCGGYNCRPISGTKVPSNHSWALAADLNWLLNPFTSPRVTDMPAWMPVLWARYGFAWGGNYTGRADSMHYEFMGTPAQADAYTALALVEIAGLGAGPGPGPGPLSFPSPAVAAAPSQEDEPVKIDLVYSPDGLSFHGVIGAEAGAGSARYKGGWIKVSVAWAADGKVLARIVALRNGGGMGPDTDVTRTIGNNRADGLALPDGCQLATVEGKRPSVATLVSAEWIPDPR